MCGRKCLQICVSALSSPFPRCCPYLVGSGGKAGWSNARSGAEADDSCGQWGCNTCLRFPLKALQRHRVVFRALIPKIPGRDSRSILWDRLLFLKADSLPLIPVLGDTVSLDPPHALSSFSGLSSLICFPWGPSFSQMILGMRELPNGVQIKSRNLSRGFPKSVILDELKPQDLSLQSLEAGSSAQEQKRLANEFENLCP